MQQRIFLPLALGCGLAQAGIVSSHGALKVQGNRIVDAAGRPIQIAGMSLYWSVWGGEKFFTANVVNTMAKNWSSSLIRAPAGVISGTGQNVYSYPATENLVKTVVDAAIANDIYVIVDWHLESADPDLKEAEQFFTDMTQKYGNTPNIIWEIWNEPKNVAWSVVKNYANTIIPLIRKKSSNLIIVGTPNWSHNPDQAASDPITIDNNIAYTLHFYANQNSNGNIDADNNSAMAAANTALKKIPLFITEWGTVGNSGDGTVNTTWSDKWLSWAKSNGISWANWALVNSGQSSGALTSADVNGGLSQSGQYVKTRIQEVTAAITTRIDARPTPDALSAVAVGSHWGLILPEGVQEVAISDPQGRELFHASHPRSGLIELPANAGVQIARVTTPSGQHIVQLPPRR